jgi:hypothetical protein
MSHVTVSLAIQLSIHQVNKRKQETMYSVKQIRYMQIWWGFFS